MINLVLCYPKTAWSRERQEGVVSEFIPPIGMEITSSNLGGSYEVTGWQASSDGSVLENMVHVILKEAD